MVDLGIENSHIRPVFRRAIEKWPDVSLSVEPMNVVSLSRVPQSERVALLVVGRNRLDSHLFERCASHYIVRLVEDGWSIKLLDIDFAMDSSKVMSQEKSGPGAIVAKLIAETKRLRYIQFLTHSRIAINLSDSGNDLVVDQPGDGSMPGTPIAQLYRSETAAEDGWVDVFGCFCRPNAQWPKVLAKALNWPVRTVYPGYSIYFPADTPYPKSAIPFTHVFSSTRYSRGGWAVWFPGSDRPVRVSEPGDVARRYDNSLFDYIERLLVAVLSVGLERVRDFRKLRHLAEWRRADPQVRHIETNETGREG